MCLLSQVLFFYHVSRSSEMVVLVEDCSQPDEAALLLMGSHVFFLWSHTGIELLFLLRRKSWPASLWLKLVNGCLLPTGYFSFLQLLGIGNDWVPLSQVRVQLWIMLSWETSPVPGTVIQLGFRQVCLEIGVNRLSFFLDICLLD